MPSVIRHPFGFLIAIFICRQCIFTYLYWFFSRKSDKYCHGNRLKWKANIYNGNTYTRISKLTCDDVVLWYNLYHTLLMAACIVNQSHFNVSCYHTAFPWISLIGPNKKFRRELSPETRHVMYSFLVCGRPAKNVYLR